MTPQIKKGHIDLVIDLTDLKNLIFEQHLPCYRQTAELEKYYHSGNSSIWQMLEESPSWVHNLAKQLPQDFEHYVVSVIKGDPGQFIPNHIDLHTVLRQIHNDSDTWRYLIFLEDWKNGHYFELNNEPVIKWRAGDWIKFHRSVWHLGANAGWEPFYSAQITVK